jgi:predicted TIM-barrel fold metal-dependent hydrolase
MDFLDPHHHLWDLERHHYPWLADEDHDRGWGDWSPLRESYLLEHLLDDVQSLERGPAAGPQGGQGAWRLVGSVHVQANIDPIDPVLETRWLERIASDTANTRALPKAIVAWADFSSPGVEAMLDAHVQASPRVRGIRQVLNRHPNPMLNRAAQDFLSDPSWRGRIGLLSRYALSFDAQVYWHQMTSLAKLADRHESVTFILDHAGMPAERDPDGLTGWRKGLVELSRRPNVVIKLSGYGMTDLKWTVDRIKPFVLEPIELFGAERAMFASNFPVDRLMSDYARLWGAFDELTWGASPAERESLFMGTARRIYRISD